MKQQEIKEKDKMDETLGHDVTKLPDVTEESKNANGNNF
jgi:hypothetical protein